MYAKRSIIVVLVLASLSSMAQEQFTSSPRRKGAYSLVAYISSGASLYASESDAPNFLNPKVQNLHPIVSVRVMWHPDQLLKVGLETGHLTFYSYTFSDSLRTSGKARLSAVPLLIEWSMSVTKRLNLFAGSGLYFLTTHLDYSGKTVSDKLSVGWMAAGSYIQPLSKNVGLGGEIKWMRASETQNGALSLQLQLVWKFLKW